MGRSYVVIGDGIAGSSAAETLREEDPDGDIRIITDEGEPLYNRILIKEFAKGKLPEAPIAIHEEEWYEERAIRLDLNTHVTTVDPDEKVVHTHRGEAIEYDKLLIATGGTPSQLPVEGGHGDGIYHFWTFQDARAIREHAAEAEAGVVIGAGLLGIDLAAICAAQDVRGHYLMRGDRWWRYALSRDGGEIIHEALRERDVTPVFDSGAERFELDDSGAVRATIDTNGTRFDSDFVGVAIGLNFNTEFLQGTEIERDDGIVVDQHMRTNIPDVYAAGDITRFYDVIVGEYLQNGSWGSAKTQGRVAAENMAADAPESEFRWVSSYSITHFDFPFLSFGHPTNGDRYIERKYDDETYRRIALLDGRIIGGVLIGDLAPQNTLKRLVREEVSVEGFEEELLAEQVDDEAIIPAVES